MILWENPWSHVDVSLPAPEAGSTSVVSWLHLVLHPGAPFRPCWRFPLKSRGAQFSFLRGVPFNITQRVPCFAGGLGNARFLWVRLMRPFGRCELPCGAGRCWLRVRHSADHPRMAGNAGRMRSAAQSGNSKHEQTKWQGVRNGDLPCDFPPKTR